jgi:hypothetical protein
MKKRKMEKNRVKNFEFLMAAPSDIKNDYADIFVTLEGDDFQYWIEITTPENLISGMEREKKNFVKPGYPVIIVRELSRSVILEALEEFATAADDDFWIKVYSLTAQLETEDWNLILKQTKEKEAEDEKDLMEEE